MIIIKKYSVHLFFVLTLVLGIFLVKDFGINIEEHTQRYSGLYWLDYVLSYTNFNNLKILVGKKLEIAYDPQLPNIDTYGPIFDLPAALIETIFNITDSKKYFQLRHYLIFLIFYLSSIFFFKIILSRFKNVNLSLIATFLFVITPRIFGDSFHNNKDILFLSILTISFYYLQKFYQKKRIFDLIIFAIFCSLGFSTRVTALFVPVMFIVINFFDNYKKLNIFFKETFLVLAIFFIALIIHWPYLWENPIHNFINIISNPTKNLYSLFILFNSKYYLTNNLPDYYLLFWIFISTPLITIFLYLVGIYFALIRFIHRLTNISIEKKYKDLWRGNNEKFENFCLISLLGILFVASTFSLPFISGWRHFYFLHFFFIYFLTYGLHYLIKIYNIYKQTLFIGFLCALISISSSVTFHPYESLYFNKFFTKFIKNGFQVDMPSLSATEALETILKDTKKNKIYIGTAAYVPLERFLDFVEFNIKKNKEIFFVGTEFKYADYIYTNYIYEVDIKYNKKYEIPKNFYNFKTKTIDNIKIFSIYKKNY